MLLFCTPAALAEARRIALTFDDVPRVDTAHFTGPVRAQRLIAALREARIPQVAFFCNTVRFDAEGIARTKAYAAAGHLIGNHAHQHLDLHRVGVDAFMKDVTTADEILAREVLQYRKWLRFPFLREGRTVQERDAVRSALRALDYRAAYVTVDNYDWYMDQLFQEAVKNGKSIAFDRLRDAYVDILMEGIEFYDGVAQKTLGRSPIHVMLLHENDLAALFIGDLVKRLRERGWEIVSPESAYEDPIAAAEPQTLTLGQGRVMAMAIDRGYMGPRGVWEDEEELKAELARRRVWE